MKPIDNKSGFNPRIMIFPLICITAIAASDSKWVVEEIVTSPMLLLDTDLVLDTTDQPHVVFIAANNLIYARRESGTWSLDTLSRNPASSVSIDLFSTGIPAVAYVDQYYPDEVNYLYFNGSSWLTEKVGCIFMGTRDACLAIDSEDVPRILYHYYCYLNPYNASTRLSFCTRETTGWESDLILSYGTCDEGMVYNFDLDLTHENQPRVVYGHTFFSTSSFEFAWPDQRPEFWNWNVIAFGLDLQYENALDVDPNGVSHCSFRRYSNLYYAIGGTSGFNYEVVDTEDDIAVYSDIQGDSQSIPHIVYDASDGLRYATKPGSDWKFDTVGTPSAIIRNPSICLDSYGYPHITWIEIVSSRVMYAHYYDPSGVGDPTQPNPGSLMFDGVNPNPFSNTAVAEFSLVESARVALGIFSIAGRLVWENDCEYPSGNNTVQLPQLEPGVYILRMNTTNQVETGYFTICN